MRRRHKIVMSAMAAVVPLAGWLAFVPAAAASVPPYDNTQDTVVCTTVTKGIIKVAPPLVTPGVAQPTTLTISGTLGGCSSASHPGLVFPEGKSKFKGTISGTTNDCGSLAGPTTGSGTITFTWSATDSANRCVGGPTPGIACSTDPDCGGGGGTCQAGNGAALLQKTSILALPTGAAVGGVFVTATQPTAAYGQFVVGPGNGVAVQPSVTNGFQGGNSGHTSNAAIVTVQGVVTLAKACAIPPAGVGKGIKQINIGTGAITLQ